ncbi:hypothetical protein F3J34_28680 [Klebsiella sp. Ap-873]|nr:hypothetical protein [Klebsiella sp. Ap-873]
MDSHNFTGVWKMFDRTESHLGAYDGNLED